MPQRAALWAAALLVFIAGCKATYPTGQVQTAIAQICQKEYGQQVEVREAGTTLGAVVRDEDILLTDLSLSDKAMTKVENVMLATTRVTLSSEVPFEFFVISVLDEKTGVAVSFVRYLKDIRRMITDDISRTEYFQRMLIETEALPRLAGGQAPVAPPFAERKLDTFLARQIGERLWNQFQSNTILLHLFQIAGCQGEFQPGSRPGQGVFSITVFFRPGAPAFERLGTETARQDLLKAFATLTSSVLRRYEFSDYTRAELVDARGVVLSSLRREDLKKDNVNSLMEMIRTLKEPKH